MTSKMIGTHSNEDSSDQIKVWAKISSTNAAIHADDATKDQGPFYCPDTFDELIVRKCVEKRDHFAYKARLSPVYQSNESKLHAECKKEICDYLKQKFPDGKWAVEREVPENRTRGLPKLVPDISGRIKDKPIIIEVQVSSLTLPKILKRVKGYYQRGAAILWIIPLKEKLGTESFRPRLFEKYLHSMYFGRAYYWIKGNGSRLIPVHYDSADRWINESRWFEADGTERMEGGYFKTYKNTFKPNYGPEILIEEMTFHKRKEFIPENENKTIPECNIMKDTLKKWWKESKMVISKSNEVLETEEPLDIDYQEENSIEVNQEYVYVPYPVDKKYLGSHTQSRKKLLAMGFELLSIYGNEYFKKVSCPGMQDNGEDVTVALRDCTYCGYSKALFRFELACGYKNGLIT